MKWNEVWRVERACLVSVFYFIFDKELGKKSFKIIGKIYLVNWFDTYKFVKFDFNNFKYILK